MTDPTMTAADGLEVGVVLAPDAVVGESVGLLFELLGMPDAAEFGTGFDAKVLKAGLYRM